MGSSLAVKMTWITALLSDRGMIKLQAQEAFPTRSVAAVYDRRVSSSFFDRRSQTAATTPWFSFEAAELLNEPENIACLPQSS
jgi:predicted ester cyclase